MKIKTNHNFKRSIFSFYSNNDTGWIRLFGRGISWKNYFVYGFNFSEKYNFKNFLKIGKWIISYLPKYK